MRVEPDEDREMVSEHEVLKKARNFAEELIEKSQLKSKERYDKNRVVPIYKVNDLVCKHKPYSKVGESKLSQPWEGPCKILKQCHES